MHRHEFRKLAKFRKFSVNEIFSGRNPVKRTSLKGFRLIVIFYPAKPTPENERIKKGRRYESI
jgi:hypothetical protein